jgi:stage V sporulation protein B
MENIKSLYKNPFVAGTLLLTLSSLMTKFIGFFYRIFISRIFTEEALGIFGLCSPVMMLAGSICTLGIQNAITHFVAASKNNSAADGYCYLFSGLSISLLLSVGMTYLVYNNSLFIATNIIGERRCAPLLKICALSFPLASIHSCINGFYYGLKKTSVPSMSVVIEQLIRVLTVYLLYKITLDYDANISLSYLCLGMVIGELSSAIFSITMLCISSAAENLTQNKIVSLKMTSSIIKLSFPLSLNKIFISVVSSFETIQLPKKLIESGLTNAQALSLFGVFNGIVIPLIMFPQALTGSIASLILPSVSEDEASGREGHIKKIILLSTLFCFLVGIVCFVFFFVFADIIGEMLFKSTLASSQIRAISFICPFLYISGTLLGTLHGLGKTFISFLFNIICTILRVCFIFVLVPHIGFSGFIYGNLASIILLDLLIFLALRRYFIYNHD